MSYLPRRSNSVIPCIEMMESRELLSASIAPAVHKTPQPVPSIAGETFTGTALVKGRTFTVSLTLGTESTKGAFRGTISVDGVSGKGSGSVNSKRAVSFHGRVGEIGVILRGTLDSSLTTFTGRGAGFAKGGSAGGTVTLTEVAKPIG